MVPFVFVRCVKSFSILWVSFNNFVLFYNNLISIIKQWKSLSNLISTVVRICKQIALMALQLVIFQERTLPFFIKQYNINFLFILVLFISVLFSFFLDMNMILSLGDLLFKCLVVCSDLLASFTFFSVIAFFLFFKIIVFFFA